MKLMNFLATIVCPKGLMKVRRFCHCGRMELPGLGLVLELVDQHNDFYSQPGRSFSIAVSWETIFPLAHMCGFNSYSVYWNQINAKQMYFGTCPSVVCGGLQFRPSELHVFQGQGSMTRG
jgi:hypothetical protein